MSTPKFEGRWYGASHIEAHSTFRVAVIAWNGSSWTLQVQDRHYEHAPTVEMRFVSDTTFVATIRHWILDAMVQFEGAFRHDRLFLNVDGEGMTGLEKYTLILDRDRQRWERFLTPINSNTGAISDPLVSEVLRSYSAAVDDPCSPRIEALAVVEDSQVTFESYFWGLSPSDLHQTSSCTKSITALLAGIAIDQGLFSLDDVLASHFPWIKTSWADDPPVLVRHALSMTSGTAHLPSDAQGLLASTDIEAFVLGMKRETAPGTRYHYDNGLPALVGCLMERTSHMSLEEFAEKFLFGPLGITQYRWTRMRPYNGQVPPPSSTSPVLAAGGLHLPFPSFYKIGILLQGNGVFDNRRIVSEAFMEAATSRQTPPSEYPYGFYFHINDPVGRGQHVNVSDGYMALGQGEQFIFVSPREKLIVAGLSSSWHWGGQVETEQVHSHERTSQKAIVETEETRGEGEFGRPEKTFRVFSCLNRTLFAGKSLVLT